MSGVALAWLWAAVGCGGAPAVDPALPRALDAARQGAPLELPGRRGQAITAAELRWIEEGLALPEGDAAAVELLVEVVARADPAYADGLTVVRDPRAVRLLAQAAGARSVDARDAAVGALMRHAPSAELVAVRELVGQAAVAFPDDGLLLLAAKAGVPAERLRGLPDAVLGGRAGRIALAAGGDAQALEQLLAALEGAASGDAVGSAIADLGHVGSDPALRALAPLLRSGVRRPLPDGRARSVRLDVLQALLFRWPEERAFAQRRVRSDKDYLRAERALRERLGVELTGERPPFFTVGPAE